jgi:hypothetical protein
MGDGPVRGDRSPGWLKVRVRVPSGALDAPQLVQRLKFYKPSAGYGDFVTARNGSPEIGEAEFRRLWDRMSPHPHEREEWVPFAPDWTDGDGRLYQVLGEDQDAIRLLRDDGVMGQCSRSDFSELFRPVVRTEGAS